MVQAIQRITGRMTIASARTTTALEFTDRLRQLGLDIDLIALAVEGVYKTGVGEDGIAIIAALRKLQREIDDLADQVLPPVSEEQQKLIEGLRENALAIADR